MMISPERAPRVNPAFTIPEIPKDSPNFLSRPQQRARCCGEMRRNSSRIVEKLWLICGLIAAAALPAPASVRAPDSARQLIHDPRSGLALFGYDPVAYHSERRALMGKPQFEAEALGYVWLFATAANRAAFLETPEAYLPLFGGHDAKAVGDDRMVQGDPAIFLIANGLAVFFRSIEDRDAYARDHAMRRKATDNWPKVARQLAGH
jgi:hypothetical protein